VGDALIRKKERVKSSSSQKRTTKKVCRRPYKTEDGWGCRKLPLKRKGFSLERWTISMKEKPGPLNPWRGKKVKNTTRSQGLTDSPGLRSVIQNSGEKHTRVAD